ncbi:MAG: DegT/DnrJ/EryC1/StrS aminotransferase family protein [Dehalococcoidales bacterium]|nr:DegT/DnrJ/EryC1/StrS aminotransferase family protein [Dehalococcoidales bacterium]
MHIPLAQPYIGEQETKEIARVISSKRLAIGDTVKEFERALAEKFQRKYCVAVSSGTAALYLALKTLGIRHVIIPVLTCQAVLRAALNAGASVIFADVVPETHNLDLSSLSDKQLSEAEAIVVTQTYGHAADMDKLDHYLKKYNLALVEDFAQATGGYFKDRILGSFGRVSITSFYATKNMTTGHGGALLMDDEELYLKCQYGSRYQASNYYQDLVPMNFMMTDIQAAIGLVQLSKLDTMVEMRRNLASIYNQELEAYQVGFIHEEPWTKHAYFKYAAILPSNVQKQAFIQRMGESGIEAGKLYDPPLHKTRLGIDFVGDKAKLPNAERLAGRTVSLPMFPGLSGDDVKKVCEAIKSAVNSGGDK